MTASSGEYLAKIYGRGASLQEFSACLPQNARIADVGAGRSNFGALVADRRPDIEWTNFDIQYSEGAELTSLQQHAPNNVEYVQVDALNLPQKFHGRFNRVFSYHLVFHLLLESRELGQTALTSMLGLLNKDGILSIGPTNSATFHGERRVIDLEADATRHEIDEALDRLTASRFVRRTILAMNTSGTRVFPARRFDPNQKLPLPVICDDENSSSWHYPFSREGAKLAGRLVRKFIKPS